MLLLFYSSSRPIFTLQFTTNTVLGTNDVNLDRISIYPNPARDNFNLEVPKDIELVSLVIYDFKGSVVKEVNLSAENSENDIHIRDLTSAVYLIRIYTNNGQFTKQLIKK